MVSGLFKEPSLLTLLALITENQVQKSVKQYKPVNNLKQSSRNVEAPIRGNVNMQYPSHSTVCYCMQSNPKGLCIRVVPTPSSPPGRSATNILTNRTDRYLKDSMSLTEWLKDKDSRKTYIQFRELDKTSEVYPVNEDFVEVLDYNTHHPIDKNQNPDEKIAKAYIKDHQSLPRTYVAAGLWSGSADIYA